MDVTLRQLRAFAALARTGSFTRAADTLHVTQSALSGLIKELESNLGVRLVDRSTRRSHLSEVGREFHPVVAKILQDLDSALDGIDSLKRLRRGIVRIAAPQLMACTLLPEVIAAFSAEYPDVEVRLMDCEVESVMSRIVRGDVDIGIGPERDEQADLIALPLFEMPFMLVFPRGHALEQQTRISWSDATPYPFIALQGQFTERLVLDLDGGLRPQMIRPSNEVAFMSTALGMVSANLGVTACLPYARSLVGLYGLRMRRLHDPEVSRRFFIYSRRNASLSPAVEAFSGFLSDFVKQHDWGAIESERK